MMPNGAENGARQRPAAIACVGGEPVVSTTLPETSSSVPALEIQMLRRSCDLLDEDRQQQLLDYAQKLIEEQHTERGRAASV